MGTSWQIFGKGLLLTSNPIKEQSMELFSMQNANDIPRMSNVEKASRSTKERLVKEVGGKIVQKICFLDSRLPEDQLQEFDELPNYSEKVCLWVLHLMQLHGTAKDADLYRVFPNLIVAFRSFIYILTSQSIW